jgi:hypothetical protein
VPIRLDGPLGYTFDLETEAPHFGRSGYLLTPVAGGLTEAGDDRVSPWTMVRLRFRRLEERELSGYTRYPITNSADGLAKLLLNSEAVSLPPDAVLTPSEFHEGLIVEFPELLRAAGAKVNVVPPNPGADWTDRHVRVAAKAGIDKLTISLDTDLGSAGSYNVDLRPSTRVWLRLVLSQREKPEKGDQPYEPVLDVSIRLLIEDNEVDVLARSQAGAWLTVACLPLLAGGKVFKPDTPVYVNVIQTDGGDDNAPKVVGARLTQFTPPVWCQFTQDVSCFEVTTTQHPKPQVRHVSEFAATRDLMGDSPLQLKLLASNGEPETIQSLKSLQSDPTSQMEGVVAAIVTEFITDAFARVRERPMAVFRLDDGQIDPAKLMWSATDDPDDVKKWLTDPKAKRSRRVRLMSLKRLKALVSGQPPENLKDYFDEDFADEISMDVRDAAGHILGISKPIDIAN